MAGAGRHRGVVKFFRGSYGWLTCGEVAEKTGGRDIFLHKNQLNSVPGPGTTVEFSLTIDEKGQPKAVDAVVIGAKPTSPAPAGDVKKASEMQVKRAALMLFRGEEVLVIKEKKEGELLWSDLGGKIEAGESHLDCAVRELAEEAEGFLSAESVALLQQGLRRQYGDGQQSPQLVALRGTGSKPQAVAVFPLDCSGVEMDELLAPPGEKGDVHEMCWLNRHHPDLRDRARTRWPLLRAICALREASAGRERSRSRSPRASAKP
ncbi:unnamed protein product [Effrenium voratum]|uniref:Nudix hydrolase domain-containing protein n=1 Tax=Effrenium voratum TaxID=2562239 RepID=A0AA36HRH2_9DINO|nr:unnamed protein product [Effrenium voratum]